VKLIFAIGRRPRPALKLGIPVLINQKDYYRVTWSNETWIDSGGFHIGKGMKFTLEQVVRKYEMLRGDEYFSLDIPPQPCMKPARENFTNFEYLYPRFNVFPVVHLYNLPDLQEAIDFYKQYTNRIALGAAGLFYSKGYQKLSLVIYHYLRRKFPYLHVLGAGGPSTIHAFYKADSVDSASAFMRAVTGEVLLPNGKARHVPTKLTSRKVRIISKEELEWLLSFLDKTHFPFEVNLDDLENRALISIWVMLKAKPRINDKYTEYSRKVTKMTTARIEEEIEELCKEVLSRQNKSLNSRTAMPT